MAPSFKLSFFTVSYEAIIMTLAGAQDTTPGAANRTKPNQKPIEPNRTQSFDWSSIGSAIEHNQTGTFL